MYTTYKQQTTTEPKMAINWKITVNEYSTRTMFGRMHTTGDLVTMRTADKIGRIYAFTDTPQKKPCIEWQDGTKSIACNWDYFKAATPEQVKRATRPAFTVTVSYTHSEYPTLTKEVEYEVQAATAYDAEYLVFNSSRFNVEGYSLHSIERVS
jgi:hypothetical protein